MRISESGHWCGGRSHQPRRRLMGDSIPEQRDSNTGGNRGKTGHGMDLRIALGKASARKRRVCKEQITMESVHGREHIKGSDDKAKIAIKDTASHWRQRASGRRQAPQSERQSEQGGLCISSQHCGRRAETQESDGSEVLGPWRVEKCGTHIHRPRDAALYTTR